MYLFVCRKLLMIMITAFTITGVLSLSLPATPIRSRQFLGNAHRLPSSVSWNQQRLTTVIAPSTVLASQTEPDSSEGNIAGQTKEPDEHTITVTSFPPTYYIEQTKPGTFFPSEPFTTTSRTTGIPHRFRVLLYPRGDSNRLSEVSKNTVGLSLQYLNEPDDGIDSTVDATFSLRLKGRQRSRSNASTSTSKPTPRFDLEWSCGTRFCSPEREKLKDGLSNSFGGPLMQSNLLPEFLGLDENRDDNDSEPLTVEVWIKFHDDEPVVSKPDSLLQRFSLEDIRSVDAPNTHNTEKVRVGKIIVPIISKLSERTKLFELGAYPGVEYRILRIFDAASNANPQSNTELFSSKPGCDYELKPVYPLVPKLERQWPVRVNESDLPKLYTPGMFNAVSAIGSLFTAVGGLGSAFLLSTLVSFFFIPSKSMDPTLQVGDVLLVEKVTPRLSKNNNKVGDMVLFAPPPRLREIVSSSGGKQLSDRDLFVKRIAARPGDTVTVDPTGAVLINDATPQFGRDLCDTEPLKLIERYIQPVESQTVGKGKVFVLGDCGSVSVDSRVWGSLDTTNIKGKPIIRIWPLSRFGNIPSPLQ